ncbi:MAG: TetR/AcrR family transcriptional regulator [Pseudomonadales bacterium]
MRQSELAQIETWLDAFLWPEEDARQRVKRERILAAATDRFVQLGYRKTSIEDVAGRAGVAKGTIYLYYRNKAELLFHAAALEKRTYLTLFGPLLDPSIPPVERLAALIEAGLARMSEMPLLARLSSGDGELALALSEVDASVLERVNTWQAGFLVDLLRAATSGDLPEETLEARARVLVDLIAAVVAGARTASRGMPVRSYTRVVADILVYGVTRPAQTDRTELLAALETVSAAPFPNVAGS